MEMVKLYDSASESIAMVADHVIVKLKDNVKSNKVRKFFRKYSAKIRKKLNVPGDVYLVSIDNCQETDSLYNSITELQRNDIVEYVEPDYALNLSVIPNDPYFQRQWGLNNTGQTGGTPDADIDAPGAWNIATGSQDVVVAVVDTGIDYNHPDLRDNMWRNPGETPGNGIDDDGNGYVDDVYGWDFANNDNNPMDDNRHGTHVAGIIGATGNNDTGITGVNWSVRMAALKFLDSSGSGSLSDAAKAINYAVRMGFPITSNSWGGAGSTQTLRNAFENADRNGVLNVVAAGNEGINIDVNPVYPASYTFSSILTVAATDARDNMANFSNYGSTSVDLGAPGVSIYSTIPGNSYQNLSGTSMAAPFVSGAAALIKSTEPELSASEIKNLIMNNVNPVSSLSGVTVTGGRLNLYKALQSIAPVTTPTATPTVTPMPTTTPAATPINNIALGKPVRASSYYNGYVPSNAVDGNLNTFWAASSFYTQWIMVDLQSQYISSARIKWSSVNYPQNYSIRYWDGSSSTWRTAATVSSNGDIDEIGLPQSVNTRYILVYCGSPNYFYYTMYELELYQ